MDTKIKTASLLVFSIIAFYFARLYIVPEWIWNHFYSDSISNYDSFFALPLVTLCIFLMLPIFNAVIANAMPYLLIKFKLVSPECSSSFIRNYFIGVLILLGIITWHFFFSEVNYMDKLSYWSQTYNYIDNLISIFVAFMLFKKFNK